MNINGRLVRGNGNAPTASANKMSGTSANRTSSHPSDKSMNGFMRVILLSAALLSVQPVLAAVIPQQVILYKDGARPALDQAQAKWLAPTAAYTAMTAPARFDVLKAGGAVVQSATVQIVWQARSPAGYNGTGIFVCPPQAHAGVDLIGCRTLAYFAANDAGPAPYAPGCAVNPGGAFPCGLDVTAAFQALIEEGAPGLHFVGVAFGNGSNGPAIYSIEMFINWAVP